MSQQYPFPMNASLVIALTQRRNTDSETYSGHCCPLTSYLYPMPTHASLSHRRTILSCWKTPSSTTSATKVPTQSPISPLSVSPSHSSISSTTTPPASSTQATSISLPQYRSLPRAQRHTVSPSYQLHSIRPTRLTPIRRLAGKTMCSAFIPIPPKRLDYSQQPAFASSRPQPLTPFLWRSTGM